MLLNLLDKLTRELRQGVSMMELERHNGFLDELSTMSTKDQLLFLSAATGSIIRAAAEDSSQARDAVDRVIVLIEKSAGLRLQ